MLIVRLYKWLTAPLPPITEQDTITLKKKYQVGLHESFWESIQGDKYTSVHMFPHADGKDFIVQITSIISANLVHIHRVPFENPEIIIRNRPNYTMLFINGKEVCGMHNQYPNPKNNTDYKVIYA